MEIIPAIDLRGGRCVRLYRGDPARQTTYSASPLEVAESFQKAGAASIHVIDLDGAFTGTGQNAAVIQRIVRETDLAVQLGGGIRTLEQIGFWLETGISRVILGTLAAESPGRVAEAVRLFGSERLIVGVDVAGGKVRTRGWRNGTPLSPEEFGRQMARLGVSRFIFTDVQRDGTLHGPPLAAVAAFARAVQRRVTASGGIASVEDLLALIPLEKEGVDSVIVGRALYEGKLDLRDALRSVAGKTGNWGAVC